MRLPRNSPCLTFLLSTLLPEAIAYTLDCERARDKGKTFNLKALGGPKTVIRTDVLPLSYVETAFTIDICQQLPKDNDRDCPHGTRVCGVETHFDPDENTNTTKVIPIAGEYTTSGGLGGGNFDPTWTRLSTSTNPDDKKKEGIRLKMGGGYHSPGDSEKGKKGKPQKAVVEFLCNGKDDTEEPRKALLAREDEDERDGGGDDKDEDERKKKEQTDDGEGGTLKYIDYRPIGDDQVLTLQWMTKYACEDNEDQAGNSNSGHWGFFTWFIIIVFLAVAAYLIFGSWLNYNRYSARGWDLVPHSETLRDIPYIFKDWMRRVVNTVQGGGSRGGYSAV